MMTPGRIAIVLSGLLGIACSDSSVNEPRAPDERLDENRISEIVSRHIHPLIGSFSDPEPDRSVGILVGVTYNGNQYYYRYGQVGLHSRDSVLTKDIVFFIGSNTKVFTGTLLALADSATRGRVTPATPVASLLPTNVKIHQRHGEILLWHLATHSAGYPDGVCPHPPVVGNYPFTSMTHFLKDFRPPYKPGKYWVYSNQGFDLLGVLLSHAYTTAGTSSHGWGASYRNWPTLVVSKIPEQLGMPSTQVDYTAVSARVAQGYAYSDADGSPAYKSIDPPDWVLKSAGLPASAISSTLEDMLTFVEASISPPQGALGAAMAETQRVYPGSEGLSMGFGWQLSNGYLDKNGGLGGYQSYMAFDPDSKIGVFLFGNTSGGTVGDALTQTGRRLLGALRDSPANPSKFPPPPTTPQCPS